MMAKLKIDFVELFHGAADEYFTYAESYFLACKDRRKTNAEKNECYNYYHRADNTLTCVCDILNFDMDRVLKLTRLFRRYSEKRNWNMFFPFDKHYDAIVRYLIKEDN